MSATLTYYRSLFKCPKYNRSCVKSVLKHNCWSAIILGSIMLALGVVLRSAIIDHSSTTVSSSGLLFILIGVFIICMGPFAVVYELVSHKNRTNQTETHGEAGRSPRPSAATDPPTYNQVMTAMKTPSATYSMRFYPQVLSPANLTDTRPPPPSYADIVTESENLNVERNVGLNVIENRRMTAP